MADPKIEPQYAEALRTLEALGYDASALVNAALCSFLGAQYSALSTPSFQSAVLQANFMLLHGIRQAHRQGRENLIFRRTGQQVHVEIFHDGEAPQKVIQYHSRYMDCLHLRVKYLMELEPGSDFAIDGATPVSVRCRELEAERIHLVIGRTSPKAA